MLIKGCQVSKIQISCHSLPIKKGRYKKKTEDKRFCPLCKSSIGDELLCAVECNHPPIAPLRKNLL